MVSDDLRSIGYDPISQILEIELQSQTVYQYSGVPEKVHEHLMASSSLGKYFQNNIRDKYPFTRVR